MNSLIQSELLNMAKRVANQYAEIANLDAILLTGSVAKNMTDLSSDIDLMLYYAELPSATEFDRLQQAALASGGGVHSYVPEEGLACYHFVEGIKVDFAHQSSAEIDAKVDEFLRNATSDDETTHIIMSGIVQGVLLFGGEKVRDWQKRLTKPSEAYRFNLIRTNLRFPPTAVLCEMGIARQDYALVYELMVESIRRLINIWCGLNGKIPPGKIKGSDRFVETLTIVPAEVGKRLRAMWRTSPEAGVAIFYQLVDETLSLVQKHCADVDVIPARERLQLQLHRRLLPILSV